MIPSSRLLRGSIASSSRQLLTNPIAPTAVNALARQCRPASTATVSAPSVAAGSNATVTTLSNKMRVVTESTPGHFHAVGVYIDAGSRFETKERSGVSHLIDRLAFKVCA
jgi:processing peptidase subunit alpha